MPSQHTEQAYLSKKTFFFDNLRNFSQGILEGGFNTFAILIAIRVFAADACWKSTIAAAGYAGLLVTPATVHFASKLKKTSATRLCSIFFSAVAMCLLLSTIVHNFYAYFAGIIAAKFIFKQQVPLMIGVYGSNYKKEERGSKLSYALMILPISAMIFAYIGGKLLDANINNFRIVIFCMVIGAIGCSFAMFKIPSKKVYAAEQASMFSGLKLIAHDNFFCKILILLSILGIDNQMTIPLRIEYLANSDVFSCTPNWVIALTVSIIPATFRILSSRVWGKLFDKLHLVTIAALANSFFVFGFWIFFNSTQIKYIILAEMLIGIGHGGGLILWCLWITKIVPAKHYSTYMSANTAVVGIRNMIAPFIGYSLLSAGCSFGTLGKIASLVTLISIIGLLMMRKNHRFYENYDEISE